MDEVAAREDTDKDAPMTQHPAVLNMIEQLDLITTDALNIFVQSLG